MSVSTKDLILSQEKALCWKKKSRSDEGEGSYQIIENLRIAPIN